MLPIRNGTSGELPVTDGDDAKAWWYIYIRGRSIYNMDSIGYQIKINTNR